MTTSRWKKEPYCELQKYVLSSVSDSVIVHFIFHNWVLNTDRLIKKRCLFSFKFFIYITLTSAFHWILLRVYPLLLCNSNEFSSVLFIMFSDHRAEIDMYHMFMKKCWINKKWLFSSFLLQRIIRFLPSFLFLVLHVYIYKYNMLSPLTHRYIGF